VTAEPQVALVNKPGGMTPLQLVILAEELMRSRIADRVRCCNALIAVEPDLNAQHLENRLSQRASSNT